MPCQNLSEIGDLQFTYVKKLHGIARSETLDQTILVYKIECKQCMSVYVGEKKRALKAHAHCHKNSIERHVPACAGTKSGHGKFCVNKNERTRRKDGIITETMVRRRSCLRTLSF